MPFPDTSWATLRLPVHGQWNVSHMDPLHYGSCAATEGDGPKSTGRRCGSSPPAGRRQRREIQSLTEGPTSEGPKLAAGPETAELLPAGAAVVVTVTDSFALDPMGTGPGV